MSDEKKPVTREAAHERHDAAAPMPADPCVRAENEDDDGYESYSDRRPAPEPMFERDPWS